MKRGPRSAAVRAKISSTMKGKKKTKLHKKRIAEKIRALWAAKRTNQKPKKLFGSSIIERDRMEWHKLGEEGEFVDFLKEKPLNNARADFLYGKTFLVFRQVDPENGRTLHIGITNNIDDASEFHGSSLRQMKRIQLLFRYMNPPRVVIVKEGLSYREARLEYKYLQQEEWEKIREKNYE